MSKTKRSQNSKKKTIRTVLICAAVAVVIALVVFLTIALQKDSTGMTCFQRHATVASAHGEKISMAEYRVTYDNYQMYMLYYGWTPEDIARMLLLEKIYTKEAKAVGITLTKEEKEACKASAQEQIDGIRKTYTDGLIESGSYTKANLDKQLAEVYDRLGMNQNEFYTYCKNRAEANLYREKLEAYYEENGTGIDEEALLTYYRENVERTMKVTDENGNETDAYTEGAFWPAMRIYLNNPASGYYPLLYVPDNFIYVDYIRLEGASTEEVSEIIRQVSEGERTFDDVMNSPDNKNTFRDKLAGPYPVAEHDCSELFTSEAAYEAAAALEAGKIGSFIEAPVPADDGTQTVTAYLFRRATGSMCIDGEHGIIKMDYIPGIREAYESQYRLDGWFEDVKFEDALYTYKGANG